MDEIWRLKHFLAAAEIGSIHGAAQILNISQPALTKSIRRLETHLDCTLFDRSVKGVTLTEMGQAVYERARLIELEWNATLAELNASGKGARGKLRIGVGPTYGVAYLPEVLAAFSQQFPNIEVSVRIGVGTELLPALRNAEISIYAGGLHEEGFGEHSELAEIALNDQENTLVAASDHPIFAEGEITLQRLLACHWVRLSHDQLGTDAIARYFQSANLPPPSFSVSTGSLSVALKLVLEKGFITTLPAPFLSRRLGYRLRALPVSGYNWHMRTGLTYRKSIKATATFLVFSRLMQNEVALLEAA